MIALLLAVIAVLLVALAVSCVVHVHGWRTAKALLAANARLTESLEQSPPAALPAVSGFAAPPWARKTPELPASGSDGSELQHVVARARLGCAARWPDPPMGQEHGRLDVVEAFFTTLEHHLPPMPESVEPEPSRVVSTVRVTKPGWVKEFWDRVNGWLADCESMPGNRETAVSYGGMG